MATPISDEFCQKLINHPLMDPSTTTRTCVSSQFSIDTDDEHPIVEATTLKTNDSQEKEFDSGGVHIGPIFGKRIIAGKYNSNHRRNSHRIPTEIDICNDPNNDNEESDQIKEDIVKSFDNIYHSSDSIGFFCGSQDRDINKARSARDDQFLSTRNLSNIEEKLQQQQHATKAMAVVSSSKPKSIKDELEALRNKKLAKNNIHALFGAQKSSNKKHSQSTPNILIGRDTFLKKQPEQKFKALRKRKEESMMNLTSYSRTLFNNSPPNNSWTSGNKAAELAALRSQQLATSFRKDLLETGQQSAEKKGVHLSAGDAFFHKQSQQKKEWRKKKKEESRKYLTNYGSSNSDFFSPSRHQDELTALRDRHLTQSLRRDLMSPELAAKSIQLPRGDNFVLKQSRQLEELIRKKDITLNELRTKYRKKIKSYKFDNSHVISHNLPATSFRANSTPNIHPFFLHQQSVKEEWRQRKRESMAFLHASRGYSGRDNMSSPESETTNLANNDEKLPPLDALIEEKGVDAEKESVQLEAQHRSAQNVIGRLSLERVTDEITRIKIKTAAKKTEREIQRMLSFSSSQHSSEEEVDVDMNSSTTADSKEDPEDCSSNEIEIIEREVFIEQEDESESFPRAISNEEDKDNDVDFISNDQQEGEGESIQDDKNLEKCEIVVNGEEEQQQHNEEVLQNLMEGRASEQAEQDTEHNTISSNLEGEEEEEEEEESISLNLGEEEIRGVSSSTKTEAFNVKLRESRIQPPNSVHPSKIICKRVRRARTSKIVPPKVINIARMKLGLNCLTAMSVTSNIGTTESVDESKYDGIISSSDNNANATSGYVTPKKNSSCSGSTIQGKKKNKRRKSFSPIRRGRRLLDSKTSSGYPVRKSKSVSPVRVGKIALSNYSGMRYRYWNECRQNPTPIIKGACPPLSPFRFGYSPDNSSVLLYRKPIYEDRAETCNNKQWIVDLHGSRTGCERCLRLASQEDRKKFEEVGHHYRICRVRGGCSRACKLFPRSKDELPVRLCRKCFYDTHHLGKV